MKKVNNKEYFTNAVGIINGEFEYGRVWCARFKGSETSVFLDQKEFSGNVFSQIEDTLAFLKANINLYGEIGRDELYRVDKYEIPFAALREAIVKEIVA